MSTWFSASTAALAQAAGAFGPFYEAEVAAIQAALEDYLTTDPDGNPTLDVNGFLALARDEIATIDDPGDPYSWMFPSVLRSTDLRPLIEKLAANLTKNVGTGVDVVLDIQPMLDDCEAKSKAVTDYFDKLFDDVLPDALDVALESGNLGRNVPPIDDLTKKTVYWRATFVNDWGNESQPSPVSVALEMGLKDTATVARPDVPADRNIDYWRLYRSNSGSSGAAWQYVPNADDDLGIPEATDTFEDDIPDSELQEVCPSLIWAEPPAELSDVQAMANGIHVGVLDGRTLCPSENFKHFTFPVEYRKAINDEVIKTLGWETALFVATRGRPHFLIGNDASTMSLRPVDGEACVSARSVAMTRWGPVYASPDGLCLAHPESPVKNLTAEHFSQEEWRALGPEALVVREHDGIIYMMRDNAPEAVVPAGSFTWDPSFSMAPITYSGTDGVTFEQLEETDEYHLVRSTFPKTEGKWYVELNLQGFTDTPNGMFGVGDGNLPPTWESPTAPEGNNVVYLDNRRIWKNGEQVGGLYGSFWSNEDRVALRLDADAGTVAFYRNDVFVYSTTLDFDGPYYLIAAVTRVPTNTWTVYREQDGALMYAVPAEHSAWG